MKKLWCILCLSLCLSLLCAGLAGCHDRSGAQLPERGDSREQEEDEEREEDLPAPPPEESAPPEPEEDYAAIAIDDQEQISRAMVIVLDLLDRAEVCNDIFRGNLDYDKFDTHPGPEGGEYAVVTDSRFSTMSDVETYWNETFYEGSAIAAGRYEDIGKGQLYASANGYLYRNTAIEVSRMPLLTIGEWNPSVFYLLELEEDRLLAAMETTLAGQDNGLQKLSMIKLNGEWLLDDSYFLD